MRMLLKVSIPVEAGNHALKEGLLAETMVSFVERAKPEAAYFLPQDGRRSALFVVDLEDTSSIPSLVEPFFTNLNASVELTPVMNLEDMKTGVQQAMKGR